MLDHDILNLPPLFGYFAGFLFSMAWWLMIDFMPLEFPYWIPIVVNSLAFILINMVNISQVTEEYGNRLKLYVVFTLAMHIGSIMACIVFIVVYSMHYSILVHNIMLFAGSMVFWTRGLGRFDYSIRL